MVNKKIDNRIRTLLENGVKTNQRSMILIVGDKGRDQVVNLHYILSKCTVRARPSVLWCYKKELGFSSHKKKRMREIKSQQRKGLSALSESQDPFELFLTTTEIRYTYYKDSFKILGNTFGMCVLQDFEALTPNLLARTIETVEGGGLIVVLLKSMDSLKQLYTMTMDAHARFRTDSHGDVRGRFNERFILTVGQAQNMLAMDDQLNILPISSHMADIKPIEAKKKDNKKETELSELKVSMKDTEPVGSILNCCRTLDQARALLTFVEAISEKTLRSTVSLTAGRGRGKSAALGLSMAAAVAFGYSNIFVTAPSPENLKTLFEFIFKGLDALKYKEHLDYELIQSTNPDFNKAIVRVNIFHSHRQTIQYIQPNDADKMAQAELVVIDEAAAIPLPIVKRLLGPYLVFMSSTINGYEGTGRSLSLKLINQLRQQSTTGSGSRILREIELKEPIRYSEGDPVEKWLWDLLCLDASSISRIPAGFPHPSTCELYYVNRDTLFSYHSASEDFLQKLVALFVASHYKNTPDDLLLLSDAPAHHIFVLLGPVDTTSSKLPDILCAVQVCLEGRISRKTVQGNHALSKAAPGDLIPWTVSQQFQDDDFPTLSGARIVRICTHPDYQRAGYGSRAVELLKTYYEGNIANLDEQPKPPMEAAPLVIKPTASLASEKIEPRDSSQLPPLLSELKDVEAPKLHYLGTSFGLTLDLLGFWKKNGYSMVYLRQNPNALTGENTAIMMTVLNSDLGVESSAEWLQLFATDFKKRFCTLLSYSFKTYSPSLALSVLEMKRGTAAETVDKPLTQEELDSTYSPYDLKRLESYAANMLDYHVVMDLIPSIANFFFMERLPLALNPVQGAILLAVGLQRKSVEELAGELNVPTNQVLALFNKCIKKLTQFYRSIQEKTIEATLPQARARVEALDQTVEEELEEGSKEMRMELKKQQSDLLRDPAIAQFAVGNRLDSELRRKTLSSPNIVSVKSSRKRESTDGADDSAKKKKQKFGKKPRK